MLYKKMKCIIGRCYLILAILVGTAIVTSAQEQFIQDSIPYDDIRADESDQIQKQEKQNKNDIPIGLFAYNKWVDLNENEIVEKNEFFGLGNNLMPKESLLVLLCTIRQYKREQT